MEMIEIVREFGSIQDEIDRCGETCDRLRQEHDLLKADLNRIKDDAFQAVPGGPIRCLSAEGTLQCLGEKRTAVQRKEE
jgi:hypothetical protein